MTMRTLVMGTTAFIAAVVSAFSAVSPSSAKSFESINGLIAYAANAGGVNQIFVVNPDGTGRQQLTNGSNNVGLPKWSPDGSQIAYVRQKDDKFEIFVMSSTGSDVRQLTTSSRGESYVHPTWSPDGSRLAFTFATGNTADIWVMNADGSNQTPLTSQPEQEAFPDWSPDGTKIAYVRQLITLNGELPPKPVVNWELFEVNSNGTGATRLTSNTSNEGYPDWRPSGTSFLFVSDRSGDSDVYEYEGGVFQALATGLGADSQPSVAPVGSGYAYYSVRGDSQRVLAKDDFGTWTVASGAGVGSPSWGVAPPRCGGRAATHFGTNGAETLTGTTGADVIVGLGGNDTIMGLGGEDLICAGLGDDVVVAGTGNDKVFGDDGRDSLRGDDGSDVLVGGPGPDSLDGGAGTDTSVHSHASAGVRVTLDWVANDGDATDGPSGARDNVRGTVENVLGGPGDDTLWGSGASNRLSGAGGNDALVGSHGNDTLDGGTGRDRFYGQGGADYLKARDGLRDALIDGGYGTDAVTRDIVDPAPILVP